MLQRLAGFKNRKVNKEGGFTLVELLIVVAIIAILAAIAIPQFSQYRARAFVATMNADIKNVYTAAQAYLTDWPNATITSANLTTAGYNPSANVSFTSSTTVLDSGTITITGNFPINKATASVDFAGVINPANDN